MADKSTEISQLEEILNSGARNAVIDGVTVTFENADAIRRRLRELNDQDDSNQGRRPRISSVHIGKTY